MKWSPRKLAFIWAKFVLSSSTFFFLLSNFFFVFQALNYLKLHIDKHDELECNMHFSETILSGRKLNITRLRFTRSLDGIIQQRFRRIIRGHKLKQKKEEKRERNPVIFFSDIKFFFQLKLSFFLQKYPLILCEKKCNQKT